MQNQIPDLTLNDEKIQRVSKTRYLGIQINESLSWKEHCTATMNKLIGGSASLRKLQNILPQSKLENIYKALFESHLHYGSVIWDSLSPTKLEHLQCLQTRAISIMQSAKYKDAWTAIVGMLL